MNKFSKIHEGRGKYLIRVGDASSKDFPLYQFRVCSWGSQWFMYEVDQQDISKPLSCGFASATKAIRYGVTNYNVLQGKSS